MSCLCCAGSLPVKTKYAGVGVAAWQSLCDRCLVPFVRLTACGHSLVAERRAAAPEPRRLPLAESTIARCGR